MDEKLRSKAGFLLQRYRNVPYIGVAYSFVSKSLDDYSSTRSKCSRNKETPALLFATIRMKWKTGFTLQPLQFLRAISGFGFFSERPKVDKEMEMHALYTDANFNFEGLDCWSLIVILYIDWIRTLDWSQFIYILNIILQAIYITRLKLFKFLYSTVQPSVCTRT